MSGAVQVRRIAPDDTEAMRAMIVGIQHDEYGFDITLDDQPDLFDADLFEEGGYYAVGGGAFWVAVDGAAVVGSIALRDIGGGVGALRKMFVAAGERGERGDGSPIAERLLAGLVEHARTHGFRRIVLGTTERFVAAHRFYDKHGFVPIEEGDLPPGFPPMSPDTRFYELPLTRDGDAGRYDSRRNGS